MTVQARGSDWAPPLACPAVRNCGSQTPLGEPAAAPESYPQGIRTRFGATLPCLLFLALVAGCQRSAAPTAVQDDKPSVAEQLRAKGTAKPKPAAEEIWEVYYLQNAKVGYARTNVRTVDRQGQSRVEVTSESKLTISRFGQTAEQTLKTMSLETSAGELLEFTTEVTFGPTPTVVRGRVQEDKLLLETETQGKKTTGSIAWSKNVLGFRGVEQSLERDPLKPGKTRSLKALMPLVNQISEVELTAGDFEMTDVLGTKTKLLRIENVAKLPGGQALSSTLWTNAAGQTIKTRIAALNNESFRTSRQFAIAPDRSGASFDLGADLIIKLEGRLANPTKTRKVVYRVALESDDPAKVFATGLTQSLKAIDAHTAELTVHSVRPGEKVAETDKTPAPPEYLAANSVLQIDDPRIIAMAKEGKGDAKTPTETVLALERYVHSAMSKKNFSQAFATAAEVAESREGDCTEHAVLLAALARACGIPSRVAIGLVYVASEGGFGYHMWTEVQLDGAWVPLDATLGQGGIGAEHLKLTDSSLDGASAYGSFLPVIQVVGQLKVEVVAAE